MMSDMDDAALARRFQTIQDEAAIVELKRRYKPLVMREVNVWSSAPIPKESIESEAWLIFVQAIKTWKPGKAALSTHLTLRLKRLARYVRKHQNAARISEQNISHIGNIDRARQTLADDLGRMPTNKEIGKAVGLSARKITSIENQRRGDLFEGLMDVTQGRQDAASDRVKMLILDFREELEGQELEVYDYMMGTGGKRAIKSKGALAVRMGISAPRLSQIIKSISTKLAPHLRRAQSIIG